MARLASLQPQVELLDKRLKELKREKDGEEDASAFLDTDITVFKEHYRKVLEDLRARERQLQLSETFALNKCVSFRWDPSIGNCFGCVFWPRATKV